MGKAATARNRKKSADGGEDAVKRIVVIDHDKVKPNSEAFRYLKRHAGGCGKDCIQVIKKKVIVREDACPVSLNRCKQCPGDAVSVVRLPTNLTADTTHRYGPNCKSLWFCVFLLHTFKSAFELTRNRNYLAFKLHGLPVPKPGNVLGLLGTNGTGKSTGKCPRSLFQVLFCTDTLIETMQRARSLVACLSRTSATSRPPPTGTRSFRTTGGPTFRTTSRECSRTTSRWH